MDAYEATQVVFARVQAQDPENVSKIIGFLLLQDRSEQEMSRLAMGSDPLLQSAVARARRELGIAPPRHFQFMNSSGGSNSSSNDLAKIHHDEWFGGGAESPTYAARFKQQQQQQQQRHSLFPQVHQHVHEVHPQVHEVHQLHELQHQQQQQQQQQSAWKPCLYYSRGYCKHGSNCRFLHGSFRDHSPSASNSSPSSPSSSSSNGGQQQQQHCPFLVDVVDEVASLDRLEMELQELLRSRRTPISIASLPQLYFEKFGKALQAQGYLTESQRHGKPGCSLTKLLARLKGSLALIDSRPHGQHAVVLAEDAQRFVGYRADRDDLKDASPCSRQIYLTFPADSSFTEDDVSTHFRAYGPVQDVRIPYQQKRMFGFVTFLYTETVKTILSEGNPHYICGARVLVKPYREKAKPSERKMDNSLRGAHIRNNLECIKDFVQDANARYYDAFARRLEEERLMDFDHAELERRRILDYHSSLRAREAAEVEAKMLLGDQEMPNPVLNGIHVSNGVVHHGSPEVPATPHNVQVEPTMTSEELQQFQSSSPFGFVLDVLDSENGDEPLKGRAASNGNCSSDVLELEQSKATDTLKTSQHYLPDNPFTGPHLGHNEKPDTFSDDEFRSSLHEKMMGLNLNQVFQPSASSFSSNVVCCICLKHCIEPSKLECNHIFCVQCILKVIRGSKDECPICRQHIGSQVYKILQNRDLQSWLSPTTLSHQRVAQHIW